MVNAPFIGTVPPVIKFAIHLSLHKAAITGHSHFSHLAVLRIRAWLITIAPLNNILLRAVYVYFYL